MPLNATLRSELLDFLPEGAVVTRNWLLQRGYHRHSIDNLVKSGQLHPLQKGIYTRGHAQRLNWQSVVYALQVFEQLDLIIGGMSALEIQGYSQYMSLGSESVVYLYGTDPLPAWANKLLSEVIFIRRNINELLSIKNQSQDKQPFRHISVRPLDWKEFAEPLLMSSPERAYLELLLDVPQKISFEHADQIMQGLTNLSPKTLQGLLEQCHNIKVKRLFFWFADRHHYPWWEKINRSAIDLGKGKRMLVKGGKLDTKYQITVPQFYE